MFWVSVPLHDCKIIENVLVRLALHWAYAGLQKRKPLFDLREFRILGERELLFGIKVAGEVGEDGGAFHDAKPIAIVVY
jgi:hypothetical protein